MCGITWLKTDLFFYEQVLRIIEFFQAIDENIFINFRKIEKKRKWTIAGRDVASLHAVGERSNNLGKF